MNTDDTMSGTSQDFNIKKSPLWQDGSESEEDKERNESPNESSEEESGPNRYLAIEEEPRDSDDSDRQHRVMKSARERHNEEMLSALDQFHNAIKKNDWVNLLELFDKLNKQLEKVSKVNESDKPPVVYIKVLVLLEGKLVEVLKAKKNMNRRKAQALNSMKQKLKKKKNNYEELIAKYHDHPVEDEDQDSGEEESNGSDIDDPMEQYSGGEEKESGEKVDKRLKDLVSERGKKGTSRLAKWIN